MKVISQQHSLNVRNLTEAFELIRKAIASGYPIATWRLPNTTDVTTLISLQTPEHLKEQQFENLTDCFLINPYRVNHPINPLVLKGDIMIHFNSDKVSCQINPRVTSSEIEEFLLKSDGQKNASGKYERQSHTSDYREIVKEAVERILQGEMDKVVLSRFADFDLDTDFDLLDTFLKLTTKYPSAFCYFANTEDYGIWMGATPERLISLRDNQYFATDALAGTQTVEEDQSLSDIAWTQKEIEEQAMVSRYVIDCFKTIRLRAFDEVGPKTIKAGNLAHLKTSFTVDMEATNYPNLGSTMLELLHPTSAVCGYPRNKANSFISAHEAYDRGLYAGFLGPVGISQSSDLFVNLRCMQIKGKKARLFAGAGITADSNPEKEFIETENKMHTLLSVIKS
jgi:isochorismate synthase